MAEPKLVVDNREQLWTLLVEAAQIEHMVMCQYLYACFSLKTEPDEGLTAEQADAVARWDRTITGIAIEEMLHLALITNVMTAIGAGPTLSRPNFPRHSEYLPPGVEFALLPFGGDSVTHFLYLERPEGMERVDAAQFVPAAPPPAPVAGAEVMPRPQDFLTVGHLYRGIEQGLDDLASQLGEQVLFVGKPRAQATPERFRYPQLIAVTDLASAHAAIDEVIVQGEGARGDWRPAHYGRFFVIWNEYQKLREQDPSFEPARPVMPAFTQQPYDIDQPQPQPTEPLTREVAELFNLGYELLLHLLTRFFTHTDETDEQLDAGRRRVRHHDRGPEAAGHRADAAALRAREPRSHGRRGVPDVLPDRELRAVARGRLGTAVRTGGHTVPAMRGNRPACGSSQRGQVFCGGRCGDRATHRRVRAG